MNTHDEQIAKLIRWNKFWLGLLVCVCVGWLGLWWASSIVDHSQRLKMNIRVDGRIRFSSASDGPYVITHLYSHNKPYGRTSAAFPKALLFYDSWGFEISRAEIDALTWLDAQNQPVEAPKDTAQIRAIYHRAHILEDERSE